MNASWIEATHGDFDYYLQGITPSVAKLLERIDAERLAVASAVGVRSVSAREWLYLSYDSPGKDLFEAIMNTGSYRGIKAPPSIDHRYISEDVPMSLVPLSSLGSMLGVPTPAIDMIIQLGSILHSIGLPGRRSNRGKSRTRRPFGQADTAHGCRGKPVRPSRRKHEDAGYHFFGHRVHEVAAGTHGAAHARWRVAGGIPPATHPFVVSRTGPAQQRLRQSRDIGVPSKKGR